MTGKRYLLDTHCLIWFQEDNPKIPPRVMSIIQEPSNTLFFSQISLFEIAIPLKTSVEHSKIPFALSLSKGERYFGMLTKMGNRVETAHASTSSARTAFTRSTAHEENTAILTADNNFRLYAGLVEVIW
jgi:PIN domain nuclease of toxin-antitoxin system